MMTDIQSLEAMAAHLGVMSTQIAVLASQVRGHLEHRRRTGPLKVIVEAVANNTGFSVDQLRGKQRHRPLTDARQMAIWLSAELTSFTRTRIGQFYDRDHTTVCHAINCVQGWQSQRDLRAARVNALRVMLEPQLAALLDGDE